MGKKSAAIFPFWTGLVAALSVLDTTGIRGRGKGKLGKISQVFVRERNLSRRNALALLKPGG